MAQPAGEQRHKAPVRASAVRLDAVRSWRDQLGRRSNELAATVEDLLAKEARRQERLAHDQEIVAALKLENFEGPAWEEFVEALVGYAYQFLLAWIRSGKMGSRCREKGIFLPAGFVVPVPMGDDATQLVEDILADAVIRFEQLLREGRWFPEGGATLTTYFVGQCIICFPKLYRDWRGQWPENWVSLTTLDEESARYGLAVHQVDPADIAIAPMELGRTVAQFNERTVQALALQDLGYQVDEIAEVLGCSEKAVEMRLYHHRRRMRGEGGTA
jgi:DNA-directed RNA polymerase specialized sigma24 family protein